MSVTAASTPSTQVRRHHPQNANEKHRKSLRMQDRIALAMTSAIGTMYTVYAFVALIACWMLWQGALSAHPFDPYPFPFLLFLGNIVQLLLMPLIMVGQNIQSRHAQIRSDEEFHTTLSSYHDIELILARLDAQDAELLRQTGLLREMVGTIR
jgi:uncharacterized membrane protein